MIKLFTIVCITLCLFFITSCSSKKDVLYFNDINLNAKDKVNYQENRIQINDILSIVVSSSAQDTSTIYNINTNQTQTSLGLLGYLVSTEGTITMPVIGKIMVKDLTLSEVESLIVKKLADSNQLTNPVVTARVVNSKFTILGEVNKPGTYNYSEQNISILQALGYAGDLTINGKRQEILIIREENNTKTYATIDLTSKKWFDSPYYYIKPNDVIYVNPNGAKVKSAGYIGSLGSFLSIASIAISTVLTIIVLSNK